MLFLYIGDARVTLLPLFEANIGSLPDEFVSFVVDIYFLFSFFLLGAVVFIGITRRRAQLVGM